MIKVKYYLFFSFLFFQCVHFGGERHETRKHLIIFLKRTRKGHHQSFEHWNCFKGNTGETSERQGEAHIDFSEHTDTILNRTELSSRSYSKSEPVKYWIKKFEAEIFLDRLKSTSIM